MSSVGVLGCAGDVGWVSAGLSAIQIDPIQLIMQPTTSTAVGVRKEDFSIANLDEYSLNIRYREEKLLP